MERMTSHVDCLDNHHLMVRDAAELCKPFLAGTSACAALCVNIIASQPGETLIHHLGAPSIAHDGNIWLLAGVGTCLLLIAGFLPRLFNVRSLIGSCVLGVALPAILAIIFG